MWSLSLPAGAQALVTPTPCALCSYLEHHQGTLVTTTPTPPPPFSCNPLHAHQRPTHPNIMKGLCTVSFTNPVHSTVFPVCPGAPSCTTQVVGVLSRGFGLCKFLCHLVFCTLLFFIRKESDEHVPVTYFVSSYLIVCSFVV